MRPYIYIYKLRECAWSLIRWHIILAYRYSRNSWQFKGACIWQSLGNIINNYCTHPVEYKFD